MLDKVIIRIEDDTEKTKSGLIIMTVTDKRPPQMGAIHAINEEDSVESGIEVGDKVIFRQHAGDNITLEEIVYMVVDIDDIIVKYEEDESS